MSDESAYEAERKGPTEYPSEEDISQYEALEAGAHLLSALDHNAEIDLQEPNFTKIQNTVSRLETTANCLKYAMGEDLTPEELKWLNREIEDLKAMGDI